MVHLEEYGTACRGKENTVNCLVTNYLGSSLVDSMAAVGPDDREPVCLSMSLDLVADVAILLSRSNWRGKSDHVTRSKRAVTRSHHQ